MEPNGDPRKAWAERNPEAMREAQRRYRERHRDEILARRRAQYAANAERLRAERKAKYDPERAHEYYLANKEQINARVNAYRAANPEVARARNKAWYEANRERKLELDRIWREANRAQLDATRRERMWALKREVWEHYGGVRCVCCGETGREFLTLDHINGGGSRHRQALRRTGTPNIYRWIQQQGYPEGYRVLCMNCNFAVGIYGSCPHQQA